MFVAGLLSAQARELVVDGPVFDPRPDPVATRVAYVSGRALRIAELDGTSWELAGEEADDVSWGSAEFIAAEEMGRYRGYWRRRRADRHVVHQRPGEPGDAAEPGALPRCRDR